MLDLLLVLFLIVMLVRGFKKGFLLTVFNLTGNIVALIVAYMYNQQLKLYLMSATQLDAKIYELISKKLTNFSINPSNVVNGITSFKQFPLPDAMKNAMVESVSKEVGNMSLGIAKLLADMSLTIISAVILYFGALILLYIISRLLNLVSKLPIIRSFNAIGGAFSGLILGCIGLSIIISILIFLTPFVENELLDKAVSSSFIINFYAKNGLILIF